MKLQRFYQKYTLDLKCSYIPINFTCYPVVLKGKQAMFPTGEGTAIGRTKVCPHISSAHDLKLTNWMSWPTVSQEGDFALSKNLNLLFKGIHNIGGNCLYDQYAYSIGIKIHIP